MYSPETVYYDHSVLNRKYSRYERTVEQIYPYGGQAQVTEEDVLSRH